MLSENECSFVFLILFIEYSDGEWLLKRLWDSERNWYKTREVVIREKEADKWCVRLREKDEKLFELHSRETSLKYTVDLLKKGRV